MISQSNRALVLSNLGIRQAYTVQLVPSSNLVTARSSNQRWRTYSMKLSCIVKVVMVVVRGKVFSHCIVFSLILSIPSQPILSLLPSGLSDLLPNHILKLYHIMNIGIGALLFEGYKNHRTICWLHSPIFQTHANKSIAECLITCTLALWLHLAMKGMANKQTPCLDAPQQYALCVSGI